MKKAVLVFLMTALLLISGISILQAQDQPSGHKDTVNMDTYAKPTYYYATEDEKSGLSTGALIGIIAGAVVVVGGAAFLILKKKKK
jgi:LPXTG-motif cell wall-anchored protein